MYLHLHPVGNYKPAGCLLFDSCMQVINDTVYAVGQTCFCETRSRTLQLQIADLHSRYQLPDVDFVMTVRDRCKPADKPHRSFWNTDRCQHLVPTSAEFAVISNLFVSDTLFWRSMYYFPRILCLLDPWWLRQRGIAAACVRLWTDTIYDRKRSDLRWKLWNDC